MILKTKTIKEVKLFVLYLDSKGFKRFILRMDIYFVAVIIVKDMVLIVHIYFMYYPKPKTYHQVACLSSNNKQFDALEKAVKMLILNEKEGLPVKLEWFNHLLI